MRLAETPPRGGLIEELGGASRVLLLTLAQIERFEDLEGSIFAVYDGLIGRGAPPKLRTLHTLVALALVGGGLSEAEADGVVQAEAQPEGALRLRQIALGVLGAAFVPDWDDDGDDDGDAGEEDAGKGKTTGAAAEGTA